MVFLYQTSFIFLTALLIGLGFAVRSVELARTKFLLAPAWGLVIQVLVLFTASRFGLSLNSKNSAIIYAALVAGAMLFSILSKERIEITGTIIKKYLQLILTLFMIVVSIPASSQNAWWAFGNDDANNYVLGALRFQNHSFFEYTSSVRIGSGQDYAGFLAPFYLSDHHRPGSELFLAYNSSVLGIDAVHVFMPTIAALQIILILASIEMLYKSTRMVKLRYVILIAINPLLYFAFFAQLIAQVGGMVIAICLVVHLIQVNHPISSGNLLVLLASISGLLIWYPEIAALLAPPLILFNILKFIKQRKLRRNMIIDFAKIMIGIVVLLQTYSRNVLTFILHQAQGNRNVDADYVNTKLFPFFLQPRGIGAMFGVLPIGFLTHPLVEIFGFLLGLSLITIAWLGIIKQFKSLILPQWIFAFMFLFGIILFIQGQGFALFKLAMYIQPFLWIHLIKVFENASSLSKQAWATLLGPVLILNVNTLFRYETNSSGWSASARNEFPLSQRENMIGSIKGFSASYPNGHNVILTNNPVLAKFFMFYGRNNSTLFPDRFFSNMNIETLIKNNALISNQNSLLTFPLVGPKVEIRTYKNDFGTNARYVSINDPNSPFGRMPFENPWDITWSSNPKNVISFVDSSFGSHYYLPKKEPIAFYQAENNPLVPGLKMNAVGRYLLIAITGYTKDSKLRFNISSSYIPDRIKALPNIKLYGSDAYEYKPNTSGSMALAIPMPEPLSFQGRKYILIELEGSQFQFSKSEGFLNNLWNKSIKLDNRRFVTFANSISVVDNSESNYSRNGSELNLVFKTLGFVPYSVLGYEGLFEDGWMAKSGRIQLNPVLIERRSFIEIRTNDFKGKSITFLTETGRRVTKSFDNQGVVRFRSTDLIDVKGFLPKRCELQWVFNYVGKVGNGDSRLAGGRISFSANGPN